MNSKTKQLAIIIALFFAMVFSAAVYTTAGEHPRGGEHPGGVCDPTKIEDCCKRIEKLIQTIDVNRAALLKMAAQLEAGKKMDVATYNKLIKQIEKLQHDMQVKWPEWPDLP